MDILVVVDMQNDFITGSLGTAEAVAIVPSVVNKIKSFNGKVFATRDTHYGDYLNTAEGKALPVEHCIKDSIGWQICDEISPLLDDITDKPTFGSVILAQKIQALCKSEQEVNITLIGLCTDICVISNALVLKAYLPNANITVDKACCAGVSEQSHFTALDAMKMCQINIV